MLSDLRLPAGRDVPHSFHQAGGKEEEVTDLRSDCHPRVSGDPKTVYRRGMGSRAPVFFVFKFCRGETTAMKSEPSYPARRAFSFLELLVVLLLVSLWMSGAWVDVGQYLWLLEIPASLVWFVLLYRVLRWMIWDITAKRTFLWDIKSLIVWLFVLHIGVALMLRFGFHYSLFAAYPLSFVICVGLPLATLAAMEKRREHLRHQPRLGVFSGRLCRRRGQAPPGKPKRPHGGGSLPCARLRRHIVPAA